MNVEVVPFLSPCLPEAAPLRGTAYRPSCAWPTCSDRAVPANGSSSLPLTDTPSSDSIFHVSR